MFLEGFMVWLSQFSNGNKKKGGERTRQLIVEKKESRSETFLYKKGKPLIEQYRGSLNMCK